MHSNGHEVYSQLPVELLDVPAHMLRDSIDEERLGQLADSIAAEGLHQPLGVRGPLPTGHYEIIWGHRRLLAVRLLRWPQVTARVFPADYDPLLAAVSENLQREDLTPVEEAKALQRFIERGESLSAVARLFRRSPAWVSNRLELLHYPPEVVAAIHSGALTLGVGAVLAQVDHPEYRASLVAEATRTGATRGTAELWLAHYRADRDRIVTNFYTVQQIIEKRDAWKIVVDCEMCHQPRDYAETRGWRLCTWCCDTLAEAIGERDKCVAAGEMPADPKDET